jgi:Cdc6-like AAA superfamily ATPase
MLIIKEKLISKNNFRNNLVASNIFHHIRIEAYTATKINNILPGFQPRQVRVVESS